MKKHRFLSSLLSATLMIVGIAAPLPQKVDIPINEEMAAYAETANYYTTNDGLRFRFDAANKTATFTGYFGYEEELVVPPTVKVMVTDTYELECTVTEFNVYGFVGNKDAGNIEQITKVTIPGTIKTLFMTFREFGGTDGWQSLKEVVIEEGVERLEANVFEGCRRLEAVTIPSTVTYIDDNAFYYYWYELGFIPRGGIIYGYNGTTAEKFSKYQNLKVDGRKGIVFISLGDPPSADTTTPTTPETPVTTTTPAAPSLPDLEISASLVTLKEGDQYTITANQSDLTYKSNNTDVAVVSKNGVVTAIGQGSAIISVINSDGDVAQLKVTVVSVSQNNKTGDCNGDGEFGIADMVTLERWLLNNSNAQLTNWEEADLCEDGVIDVFDMIEMRKLLLNKRN